MSLALRMSHQPSATLCKLAKTLMDGGKKRSRGLVSLAGPVLLIDPQNGWGLALAFDAKWKGGAGQPKHKQAGAACSLYILPGVLDWSKALHGISGGCLASPEARMTSTLPTPTAMQGVMLKTGKRGGVKLSGGS